MIRIRELIEKYFKGKNTVYAILLCVGIIMLIASSSFSQSSNTSKKYYSNLEKRLTQILCQIDGVGDVTVMISDKNNETEGVIIVAQGAENPTVKNKIYNAAIAALGVKPHKIEVFSKKGGDLK